MSAVHRLIRRSTLVFMVALAAACGGGGGGGGDAPAPAAPPATPPSRIFVGDSGNQAIGSSPNSNPAPGAVVVERIIIGSSTMLSTALADFALDVANDRLYVSDLRSILAFDNVSTASGNVAPRLVSSIAGGFGGFVGIHLDTTNNRLYAGVNGAGGSLTNHEVRVFDSVGSSSNAAPTRTFTFSTNFLMDVVVDTTRDILYAYSLDATTNFTQIAVFTGASGLTGSVTPTRTISIGESFSSGPPVGMFIDAANDRLYAPRLGQVLVFDNASTKDGAVSGAAAPTRTIDLLIPDLTSITVDLAANRLYAADSAGLTIVDNASPVSGTLSVGVRVVAGSGSVFEAVAVKP